MRLQHPLQAIEGEVVVVGEVGGDYVSLVEAGAEVAHGGNVITDVLHGVEDAIEGQGLADSRLTDHHTGFPEPVLKELVGARVDGAGPAYTRPADDQFHHLRLVVGEDADDLLKRQGLKLLGEPLLLRDVGVGLTNGVLLTLHGCRGVSDTELVLPTTQLPVPHGLEVLHS